MNMVQHKPSGPHLQSINDRFTESTLMDSGDTAMLKGPAEKKKKKQHAQSH